MIFLDDGGVMNDNRQRAVQWQGLVSEFFAPRLGGTSEARIEATRSVVDRLLEPEHWQRSIHFSFAMKPRLKSGPSPSLWTQPKTSQRAAISIRRVARLSRDVGQPDHILANPIMSHKAERRPGSGEIWLAVTKHDGVQVDSILIDQAKFGEAMRQVRASNLDLPVALGLQLADRALKITLNKPGVGADRLQRARDDPFRLVPPRRREGVFLCIPFRMIVIPVTHNLIHLATVDTARLPLSLLDEVAEERGTWRKRHMVNVAVQGLVHSD